MLGSRLNAARSISSQVQDLEDQLRDRVDLHNQSLVKQDSLERDLENRQTSVAELSDVVQQLELQLDNKTQTEKELQEV